jgi:hypothetical protein
MIAVTCSLHVTAACDTTIQTAYVAADCTSKTSSLPGQLYVALDCLPCKESDDHTVCTCSKHGTHFKCVGCRCGCVVCKQHAVPC